MSLATHHDHAIAEAQVGKNLSADEADEVRGLPDANAKTAARFS